MHVYSIHPKKHSLIKDWHALTKDLTTWRLFKGSNARETSFFCSRHRFTLHFLALLSQPLLHYTEKALLIPFHALRQVYCSTLLLGNCSN